MKITSPQNIAVIMGVGIAFITCLFSLAGMYISGEDFFKYLLVEFLSVFFLSFIIIYFVLRGLLVNKIKPIYKIINANKSTEPDFAYDIKDRDIVAEVEEDVAIWAGRKVREIDQLKKMEKYRKEFLGNVSHELKTPIFNIQGYVSTLLDGGLEDETINRSYLEKSEKSINRMISIVQDLETISQLESGQMELQFENFSISELVREVFELQEFRSKQKKIKLILTSSDKSLIVNADRKRIMEVLINLVVNSINYGKEEGKTTVQFFDMDDRILVEVSDNGIGIPEKSLPRIFERFYRVDKSRSRHEGGTGLGLAIVKHIIEAHGQQVSVRSRQDEGSSFGFTLQKAKTK
jgi:two-component system phosphate regulon sensor histidine kinase PhoR